MSTLVYPPTLMGLLSPGGAAPTGGGAYVGLGDIKSGASAGIGLRAYSNAAIGSNCIRLTNDGGTTQQDFATIAGGGLDSAAISAFAAAGSGTVKIVTWYDQTGNGHDFTQSNDAARVILTLSGLGSLPTVAFTGTSRYTATKFSSAISQPYSISTVARRTSSFTTQLAVFYAGDGGGDLEFSSSNNTIQLYAGSNATASGATDNTWLAVQSVFNGSSSVFNILGTETTVNPGTNSAGGSSALSLGEGGGSRMIGNIAELAFWPSGLSSGERSSLNSNQRAYWGI